MSIHDMVYMTLPGNNRNNSKKVCKLNKSIYGLKKSPKCWNTKFDIVMKRQGLFRSENDHCLYFKCSQNSKLYISIYVDDLLILRTDSTEVEDLKSTLNNNVCMNYFSILRN